LPAAWLMPFMAETDSSMTSRPFSAVRVESTAQSAAWRALSEFCLIVAATCSMLAAASSRPAACS